MAYLARAAFFLTLLLSVPALAQDPRDADIQSATASPTLWNSSADARTSAAFTAERASRNATAYAFTTRSEVQPKFCMARATAPIFRGLRGETSTTRRFVIRASYLLHGLFGAELDYPYTLQPEVHDFHWLLVSYCTRS